MESTRNQSRTIIPMRITAMAILTTPNEKIDSPNVQAKVCA